MELIKSNPWSCVAASAAMVLGIPFNDLILQVGHDGSAYLYQDKTTPRGFHLQEIIDLAWTRGISVTEIQAYFGSKPSPTSQEQVPLISIPNAKTRFNYYIANCKLGIFTGLCQRLNNTLVGHAVAWDGRKIYDPKGRTYIFDDAQEYNFYPQSLWMFNRMETQT